MCVIRPITCLRVNFRVNNLYNRQKAVETIPPVPTPRTSTYPSAHPCLASCFPASFLPWFNMRDLKVDLVHHLVVGLELVELHFKVRRRQDIGQDHGVEVHSLFVAPQRQHIALLARDCRLGGAAAAALLLLLGCGRCRLVLRLRVACQRGAVVSHVAAEGRREGEGRGGGQARSRSSGQRSGTLLHGTPSKRGPPRCPPAG